MTALGTIEAQRQHIRLIGRMLVTAKQNDRDLRRTLGDGAKVLMQIWIATLERKLSNLSALRCGCCEDFVPESDLVTMSEQPAPDENPIDTLVCPDCIACPPDEVDR